ncbi:MAG: hypothetical protein WA101_01865 [Minisyncoccia bacterium]
MEKISFNKQEDNSSSNSNKKKGFVKNLGKLGRKIALGTALLGATFATEKATAQNQTAQKRPTEQSIEKNNKMQWETEVMNKMKNDINKLKTKEDIATFERLTLSPFMNNLGILGKYKEVESNYSFEEYQKMLLDMQEVVKTFESIEKKFNFERTGAMQSEIIHLLHILDMRTSYSSFHEYKKLNNLE